MDEKRNDIYEPITADALSRIPAAMKASARWVVWGGKKVPVNGNARNKDGFLIGANVTDPAAWMTYDSACQKIGQPCRVGKERFKAVGIGFVVGDDGWFCIDGDGGADHGREPLPESVIVDLCQRSGTYAEMSISKNGCHLFGRCNFKTEKQKEKYSESRTSYEIEFFTRRKFLIVTGDRVNGSAEDAIECSEAAYRIYQDYVLSGCNRREAEELKRREESRPAVTVNAGDAERFFLLNYPEILAYADVNNFKRSPGPGQYSWIGAIKAMDEIGVPRSAIYDWCRRGDTFAGENDIDRVLDEKKHSAQPYTTAAIVRDAKDNGWKPDPDKLTGEYRVKRDPAEVFKAQKQEQIEGITVTGYDDVEIKPIDFLFFPWFPRGYITMVQGDSGSSKSTFMYGVGAMVSTGGKLLDAPCEDPGNVMFITNEDDPGDIKVAFQDAGGDVSKLRRIPDRVGIASLNLSKAGTAVLDKIIKENNIKLLVLDPIQNFLTGDMNKASETRPQMAQLADIAAENHICIVFIAHTGKDTKRAALHRGIGSVDIGAATRSILQVVTDPTDKAYKIAFTVKSNLAAQHDVLRGIRYQVMDHPNSFDPKTNERIHFRGHAVFAGILPDYSEKTYNYALRKAEEAKEADYKYDDDPLVLTVRKLIEENPEGLFIGTDDLISKITECCGSSPYDQSKNKSTGIYARVNQLRKALFTKDGIQADLQSNSIYPKAYTWRGMVVTPDHVRTRGFRLTPVKGNL